ncbi:SGNH/GDSL hydrolase family protein [Paenibacillus contaminans]|uniref:SGNH hydrolase-type esterase domain-containing protein n=1 Tax=Paenibacillus contaminans TaxID=450362 RepID=A0A329M9I7_9BACL|nr:SGNH/GDSL hydrolase family protein [Paenibacillus contaminans]RAV16651.1 hypothetical protein DQG23_27825 [Paenibacillus contaminans]
MAVKWVEGLRVSQTAPAGLAVSVSPGVIEAYGRRMGVPGVERLVLTPPPLLQLRNHYYTLERQGEASPCGWDWSGRRGSNFKPYQMRMPGTLRVRSSEGLTEYEQDKDYVFDDYWGSVKAKPGGRLKVGDIVRLDYDVYTCRYILICVDAEGRFRAVEGDWRYGDETNLLLPDLPVPPHDAAVLASVFVPWGAEAVYERQSLVEYKETDGRAWQTTKGFEWECRHLDWRPRTYEVESCGEDKVGCSKAGSSDSTNAGGGKVVVRTADCAYGSAAGRGLVQPLNGNGEVDLPVAREDGLPVYWRVRLPWRRLLADFPQLRKAKVHTFPANIMDVRGRELTIGAAANEVPIEENDAANAEWWKALAGKRNIRLCFLGESTTYGGDWPLLIAKRLGGLLPGKRIEYANAADGGHSSVHGISHVKRTRSVGDPYDIVFIEYMINDTGCQSDDIDAAMTGIIDWVREHNPLALVVIVAGNGGNPMFLPHYSPAQFERVYELHRETARKKGAVFVGMYDHFCELERRGLYFMTELKENMINHPYLNTAIDGTRWDQLLADVFVRWTAGKLGQ